VTARSGARAGAVRAPFIGERGGRGGGARPRHAAIGPWVAGAGAQQGDGRR
jgi:hypothetical protein